MDSLPVELINIIFEYAMNSDNCLNNLLVSKITTNYYLNENYVDVFDILATGSSANETYTKIYMYIFINKK